MNATFTNSGMTTSQQCTTNSTTSSTCMQDLLSSHCNHSSSSMNHDEPQVLLSNHVDKKISSRYTQLRKQLRACNNFKENYFVLEVNKPHQSNAKMSSETKSKKSSQKRKQQDKVEDMQVAQAPKKVKQNESTCSSETESLHASVTSGTNLHVNISQPEISENACVQTNSNPQDDMQIQLLHTLISSLQHVQQHPSNDISNNGNIATRTTTANPIMEKLLSTWFTLSALNQSMRTLSTNPNTSLDDFIVLQSNNENKDQISSSVAFSSFPVVENTQSETTTLFPNNNLDELFDFF